MDNWREAHEEIHQYSERIAIIQQEKNVWGIAFVWEKWSELSERKREKVSALNKLFKLSWPWGS